MSSQSAPAPAVPELGPAPAIPELGLSNADPTPHPAPTRAATCRDSEEPDFKPFTPTSQERVYSTFGIRLHACPVQFPDGLDMFAALAATCIVSGQPAEVGQR
jgi:hypothetical protein